MFFSVPSPFPSFFFLSWFLTFPFSQTHTMACFVKRHFFTWNNSFLRILFFVARAFYISSSPSWKRNSYFYHTRVFAYLFRKKKKWYIVYLKLYIYIIYMLLYTHVLPQSCLIPWYRFTWKWWCAFWSVCVCTHIFFVWQDQSTAVWESFLTSVVQGRMWRSAERTNNRNKAFAQQQLCQLFLWWLWLMAFTTVRYFCLIRQLHLVVNVANDTFVIMQDISDPLEAVTKEKCRIILHW